MDVHLVGSGAVDDLCYVPESDIDPCIEYSVTYDDQMQYEWDNDPQDDDPMNDHVMM